MRLPVEWLKDYVTVSGKPEALAQRLTMAGHEVTAIHDSDDGPVLELEITPNRADCLSILGLAREVAAITGQPLKFLRTKDKRPETRDQKRKSQVSGLKSPVSVQIEDRKGCPRYIGRLIEGVKIAPSPAWMQKRLAACGIRAINNVVDITNYVLLEYGQPLHAFDFAKLAQGTIIVRRAKPSESIKTLDETTRTLTAETLVIADAARPVAVAGVMGGVGSEVTAATTTVLLESALFDPILVRRACRWLGAASESSYRFERGVDPAGVEKASARAAALMAQLAGGREQAVVDVGSKPRPRSAIIFDMPRASKWLGTPLVSSTTRGFFARLSCRVATSGSGDLQRVEPPSFRRDLTQEVDLYEEVARLIGYDRLPARVPVASGSSETTAVYWRLQSLRCLCAGLGLSEVLTWALISESELGRAGYAAGDAVRVANPLSHDHAWLRPSLIPGLLAAVRRNVTQGVSSLRLFEVGQVFVPSMTGRVVEVPRLGIALSGVWASGWQGTAPCDFFRLKGVIETLIGKLCEGTLQVSASPLAWGDVGHTARVLLGDQPVGVLGQVSARVGASLDLQDPVWIAGLFGDALLERRRTGHAGRAPTVFPPVKRDLSIVVKDGMPYERIAQVIRDVAGPLAARVELIDRYAGKQVPSGKHSLTFSIDYREASRTLAAAEVDAVHQRLVQALAERCGASLR